MLNQFKWYFSGILMGIGLYTENWVFIGASCVVWLVLFGIELMLPNDEILNE